MYPKMCMFSYSELEVTWGFSSGSTWTYNYRQKEGARRSAEKRGGVNRERSSPKPEPYISLSLSRDNSQN